MPRGELKVEQWDDCEYCSRIYRVIRQRQRFCSDACRFAWHNEKRVCQHCGKPPFRDAD